MDVTGAARDFHEPDRRPSGPNPADRKLRFRNSSPTHRLSAIRRSVRILTSDLLPQTEAAAAAYRSERGSDTP